MRLVGASSLYIQLPFLMESLVAALIGVGLAAGALLVFMWVVIYGTLRPTSNIVAWVDWGDGLWAVGVHRRARPRAHVDPDPGDDPEIPQSLTPIRLPSICLSHDNKARQTGGSHLPPHYPVAAVRSRRLLSSRPCWSRLAWLLGVAAMPPAASPRPSPRGQGPQAQEGQGPEERRRGQRGPRPSPGRAAAGHGGARRGADPARPRRRHTSPRREASSPPPRRSTSRCRPSSTPPWRGWPKSRADLAEGHEKVAEQEHELGQIVVSNYQTGDPGPDGAVDGAHQPGPAELTGQLNSVQERPRQGGRHAGAARGVQGAPHRPGAGGRRRQERGGRAASGRRREPCRRSRGSRSSAEAEELQVQNLVALRAEAEDEAEKARQADLATLKSLEQEQRPDRRDPREARRGGPRRAAAAAAAADQASVGPTESNGFLTTRSRRASPRRTAGAGTRSTATASLHDGIDFGRRLRHPDPRAGRRPGAPGVLPVRLGQPDHHRPRLARRCRRGDHLQPPQRVRRRRRRAGSSAAR